MTSCWGQTTFSETENVVCPQLLGNLTTASATKKMENVVCPHSLMCLMFAAAIGAGAAHAQQFAQKKAVARLTGMQGGVLVSQAEGMAVAGPDVRIAAGVRVVTMAGAEVTVSYDAGCNVKLEENMRFVVREGGACAALIAGVESLVPPVRAAGGAGTAAGPGRSVTPSPMAAAASTAPALAYGIYVARRNASNVSPN